MITSACLKLAEVVRKNSPDRKLVVLSIYHGFEKEKLFLLSPEFSLKRFIALGAKRRFGEVSLIITGSFGKLRKRAL